MGGPHATPLCPPGGAPSWPRRCSRDAADRPVRGAEDTRAAHFQGPAARTRAAGVTVQRRHPINAHCAFLLERGIAIPRGWRASRAELPQRTHHDREADTVPEACLLLVPNPDSSTAATAPSFDHLMRSAMGPARGWEVLCVRRVGHQAAPARERAILPQGRRAMLKGSLDRKFTQEMASACL